MTKLLDVYLHQQFVGHLIQDDYGRMLFKYDDSYIRSDSAMPLSHSLPLRAKTFSSKECRGYFAGILPEETKRKLIAKNLRVSANNDFALLELIGGECAGAVTFLPNSHALPEQIIEYQYLTEQELADVLKILPQKPLLGGDAGIRLSLAGAQDKLAVAVFGHRLAIPLENAPSTHILKPVIAHYADTVSNEFFCMTLAKKIGLPTAGVSMHAVAGYDYLLVDRYDRQYVDQQICRLHQEDFCQALGLPSEHKYQSEGGPSLIDCFDLVRQVSTVPVLDLQRLLDAVIFNYVIGNNDAHGKNFSFIYRMEKDRHIARFAPLYDILCTAFYPELTDKMAMKIYKEAKFAHIYPRHFKKMAERANLSVKQVLQRVVAITHAVNSAVALLPKPNEMTEQLAAMLRHRCSVVLERFSVD